MKSLKSLSDREILERILKSNELRRVYEDYIYSSEVGYIEDILSCFDSTRCVDYQLGINCYRYLRIRGGMHYDFMKGMFACCNQFGLASNVEKKLIQCDKLYHLGSNLFEYEVQRMCEMFFECMIDITYKFLEDIGYEIYRGDVTEPLLGFLDCFIYNGFIDGIYINEDDELVAIKKL